MPKATPVQELQANENAAESSLRRSTRIAQNVPVPSKIVERRNSDNTNDAITKTPAKRRLSQTRGSSSNLTETEGGKPDTPRPTRLTRSASKSPTSLANQLEAKAASIKTRGRRGSATKALEEEHTTDSPVQKPRRRSLRSESSSPTSTKDSEPTKPRTRRSSITEKVTQLEKIDEVKNPSQSKIRTRGRRSSLTDVSELDPKADSIKNEEGQKTDLESISEATENEYLGEPLTVAETEFANTPKDNSRDSVDKISLQPIEKNQDINSITESEDFNQDSGDQVHLQSVLNMEKDKNIKNITQTEDSNQDIVDKSNPEPVANFEKSEDVKNISQTRDNNQDTEDKLNLGPIVNIEKNEEVKDITQTGDNKQGIVNKSNPQPVANFEKNKDVKDISQTREDNQDTIDKLNLRPVVNVEQDKDLKNITQTADKNQYIIDKLNLRPVVNIEKNIDIKNIAQIEDQIIQPVIENKDTKNVTRDLDTIAKLNLQPVVSIEKNINAKNVAQLVGTSPSPSKIKQIESQKEIKSIEQKSSSLVITEQISSDIDYTKNTDVLQEGTKPQPGKEIEIKENFTLQLELTPTLVNTSKERSELRNLTSSIQEDPNLNKSNSKLAMCDSTLQSSGEPTSTDTTLINLEKDMTSTGYEDKPRLAAKSPTAIKKKAMPNLEETKETAEPKVEEEGYESTSAERESKISNKSLTNLLPEQLDMSVGSEGSFNLHLSTTIECLANINHKELPNSKSEVFNRSDNSDKENERSDETGADISSKSLTEKKDPLTNISLNESSENIKAIDESSRNNTCEPMDIDDPPLNYTDVTKESKMYSLDVKTGFSTPNSKSVGVIQKFSDASTNIKSTAQGEDDIYAKRDPVSDITKNSNDALISSNKECVNINGSEKINNIVENSVAAENLDKTSDTTKDKSRQSPSDDDDCPSHVFSFDDETDEGDESLNKKSVETPSTLSPVIEFQPPLRIVSSKENISADQDSACNTIEKLLPDKECNTIEKLPEVELLPDKESLTPVKKGTNGKFVDSPVLTSSDKSVENEQPCSEDLNADIGKDGNTPTEEQSENYNGGSKHLGKEVTSSHNAKSTTDPITDNLDKSNSPDPTTSRFSEIETTKERPNEKTSSCSKDTQAEIGDESCTPTNREEKDSNTPVKYTESKYLTEEVSTLSDAKSVADSTSNLSFTSNDAETNVSEAIKISRSKNILAESSENPQTATNENKDVNIVSSNEDTNTSDTNSTSRDEKSETNENKDVNIVSSNEDTNASDTNSTSRDEKSDDENIHEFVDNEAEEGEEDTPSEDSNEIICEGESINSNDTDMGDSDDSYEADSFIDDDNEVHERLSGEEDFLGTKKPAKDLEKVKNKNDNISPKKSPKKRKRIITPSESEDENEQPIRKASLCESSEEVEELSTSIPQTAEKAAREGNQQTDRGLTDNIPNPEKITPSKSDVIYVDSNSDSSDVVEKVEAAEESVTNDDKKSKRKSSITIHENVNLQDIEDGELSSRITKVLDWFCSGIKSSGDTGNISLNVSLDYADQSSKEENEEAANKLDSSKKSKNRKHSKITESESGSPDLDTPKMDNNEDSSNISSETEEIKEPVIKLGSSKKVKTPKHSKFTRSKSASPNINSPGIYINDSNKVSDENVRPGLKRRSNENVQHISPKRNKHDFIEEELEAMKDRNVTVGEGLNKPRNKIDSREICEKVNNTKSKRLKSAQPTVEKEAKMVSATDELNAPSTSTQKRSIWPLDNFNVEVIKGKKRKLRNTNLCYPCPSGIVKENVVSNLSVTKREVFEDKTKKIKRKKLLPSKAANIDDTWTTHVFETTLEPSKYNKKMERDAAFKKKKTDVDSFNPKDFRNRMLYDSNRVKRMDTKALLKQRKKI